MKLIHEAHVIDKISKKERSLAFDSSDELFYVWTNAAARCRTLCMYKFCWADYTCLELVEYENVVCLYDPRTHVDVWAANGGMTRTE